jgi:hypothetical protein
MSIGTSRAAAVLASVTLLATFMGAHSASAKVVESDRFSVSITDVVNVDGECGTDYGDLVFTNNFNGSLRIVQRGPNGSEMFSLNVRFDATWTNDAGQGLTVRGTLLDKDLEWIDNGDGTTTLIILLTGGYLAKQSNGGVISADPGQTRVALTFDENWEVIDEQVVKGSTGRNDNSTLCEDLAVAFA